MPCKFYFRTTVNFVHLQNYESHLILSHVHSRKTHFRGTILRVNSVSVPRVPSSFVERTAKPSK